MATSLEYSSPRHDTRIPRWSGDVAAFAAVGTAVAGIITALRVTQRMIGWHPCVGYNWYYHLLLFVALPLCVTPLISWLVALRAGRWIQLCRACLGAGVLVWIGCRMACQLGLF
jgi:hypothetical protein